MTIQVRVRFSETSVRRKADQSGPGPAGDEVEVATALEKLSEGLPLYTGLLVQLGTLTIDHIAGFPGKQLQNAIGTQLVLETGATALPTDVKWGERLLVTLVEATLNDGWRLVAVLLLIILLVAVIVWQSRIIGGLFGQPKLHNALMALCGVALLVFIGLFLWSIPAYRAPTILAGLGEGQMDPKAFRGNVGHGPSRTQELASDLYSELHGVNPRAELMPPNKARRSGLPENRCSCPRKEKYEQVSANQTSLIWQTLATSISLLCLCQLAALLGAQPIRRQLQKRNSQILGAILLVSLSLQAYRWYLTACNLGVLEAVAFLERSEACSSNPDRDPDHLESWPFCKPFLVKQLESPNNFTVANIWPARGKQGGDALFVSVSFRGEHPPVQWTLDLRDPSLYFAKGRLDLGFDALALQGSIARRTPTLAGVPVTYLNVFDGQNSGEIPVE